MAAAVTCENARYEGNRYTICTVRPAEENLRLFLRDDAGDILGQFSSIEATLPEGQTLSFGMNAGMYHLDRRPVGLYLEKGQQESKLYPNSGPGNFGLVPNGVFCIRTSRADVIESRDYQVNTPDCTYATQSGPMLVIDGDLHPRFIPESTSKFIRNGVGTTADGQTAIFVKSENSVNFHEFARFFRDILQLPQALYFDGKVSRIHAADLDRSDPGFWMGPIVGVVE
jgi:uncharacterized protein YigE (DUF2233 family)